MLLLAADAMSPALVESVSWPAKCSAICKVVHRAITQFRLLYWQVTFLKMYSTSQLFSYIPDCNVIEFRPKKFLHRSVRPPPIHPDIFYCINFLLDCSSVTCGWRDQCGNKQSFQVDGTQNRKISLFLGNTIGRFFTITFQGGTTVSSIMWLWADTAVYLLYILASRLNRTLSNTAMIDPSMPLLSLFPMVMRDKLMCRRRVSSLLTNPLICFGGCWTLCGKTVKINNVGGSRESPLSLAGIANERINDGHA